MICTRQILDRAIPLARQGQTMCVDLRSYRAVDNMLWSWLCSLLTLFRLGKQEKAQSCILIVYLNGAGQNSHDKPLTLFVPSVTMCQHCSCDVVARLTRLFSHPCMFHMLFCMFHVLFYLKRQVRLTGFSDWQAARMCLFDFCFLVLNNIPSSAHVFLAFMAESACKVKKSLWLGLTLLSKPLKNMTRW